MAMPSRGAPTRPRLEETPLPLGPDALGSSGSSASGGVSSRAGATAGASAPGPGQTRSMARGFDVEVQRVFQVDAATVDSELHSMLREQLSRVFSLAPAGALAEYGPEVDLALSALIWYFSVWRHRPPPGCQLMNLRLRNEAEFQRLLGEEPPALSVRTGLEGPQLSLRQRVGYLLLTAGVAYAAQRSTALAQALHSALINLHRTARALWPGSGAEQEAPSRSAGDASADQFATGASAEIEFSRSGGDAEEAPSSPRQPRRSRVQAILSKVEGAGKVLALANLLVFLHSGRYRTLPERLLGVRAVYQHAAMSRTVSFEFMNRQLVWNQLSESLLLVLPLLASISAKIPWMVQMVSERVSSAAKAKPTQDNASRTNSACPICRSEPMRMPAEAGCGHRFCYYCLQTRIEAALRSPLQRSYKCPLCRQAVVKLRHAVGNPRT